MYLSLFFSGRLPARAWAAALCIIGVAAPAVSQEKTIHLAARQGDVSATRAVLERGVSPDSYGSFAEAPLHAAAARGHRAIVELLLDFPEYPVSIF